MRDLSKLTPEDAAFFREKGYLPQKPEVTAWINEYARRLDLELAPHRVFIDQDFVEWRAGMDILFARDHDTIGRVLKHHLILEHYITRHLEAVTPDHDWRSARLRFAQKVNLIPSGNEIINYLIPGIREVNAVRNALGHQIDAQPTLDDIQDCLAALDVMHPYSNKTYLEAVDAIEDFTALVCKWIPVNGQIAKIFKDASERAKQCMSPPG